MSLLQQGPCWKANTSSVSQEIPGQSDSYITLLCMAGKKKDSEPNANNTNLILSLPLHECNFHFFCNQYNVTRMFIAKWQLHVLLL
jgi:hypothetical protein